MPVVASVMECSTWSRVLTSRKREGLLAGVIEELDGAGADVPHRQGEALGRRLELVGLGIAEQRRGSNPR